MSVLRNLEARLEGLVEGVFNRAFSSEVQPVELARKLVKEMDAHRTASVSRVYAPNRYTVYLSPEDRERLEGYERSLEQELSGYLLEHSRRRGYDLLTRPEVEFETDERLRLGEFGIQARMVKPPAQSGESPREAGDGRTMVYSAADPGGRDESTERRPPRTVATRAVLTERGRRYVLDGQTAAIGRSRDCECVIDDPSISRRHAELRRGPGGKWEIVDLGSTNGTEVNGRRASRAPLRSGDQVTLGTRTLSFEIEQ